MGTLANYAAKINGCSKVDDGVSKRKHGKQQPANTDSTRNTIFKLTSVTPDEREKTRIHSYGYIL